MLPPKHEGFRIEESLILQDPLVHFIIAIDGEEEEYRSDVRIRMVLDGLEEGEEWDEAGIPPWDVSLPHPIEILSIPLLQEGDEGFIVSLQCSGWIQGLVEYAIEQITLHPLFVY